MTSSHIKRRKKNFGQARTLSVRPDRSTGSRVNAALSSLSVRPDRSTGSRVNAALSSLSVRPELVEGNEWSKKKIGIWGFGRVGKATANFLSKQGASITILEKRALSKAEISWCKKRNIKIWPESKTQKFWETNEIIIPSPGIDIRPFYTKYHKKVLCELDLFAQYNTTKTVAITGSVGKTTIVTLLTELLNKKNIRTISGGNIGTPLLDLVEHQNTTNIFVLELSSFQLEYAHKFAPDLAIITNIHENHFDRHNSLAEYVAAKANIFIHQKAHQLTLLPISCAQSKFTLPHKPISFFSLKKPAQNNISQKNGTVFYFDQNQTITELCSKRSIYQCRKPELATFQENFLIIAGILFLLGLDIDNLEDEIKNIALPAHRLEKIATINGIEIYNDSKSTTPASTLAAVQQLQGKPIILLLGGLSKGIDREPLIKALKPLVKKIVCFGAEADSLSNLCKKHFIPVDTHSKLKSAALQGFKSCKKNEILLLSPAGSSFDEFKNYQARGSCFRNLVYNTKLHSA